MRSPRQLARDPIGASMHHLDQDLPVDQKSRIPDQIGKLFHLQEESFRVDRRHPLATVMVEGDQPAAVEERWGGDGRLCLVATRLADEALTAMKPPAPTDSPETPTAGTVTHAQEHVRRPL